MTGNTFDIEPDDEFEGTLSHIGVARKSGRYPWGSGDNPNQRNKKLLTYIDELHKKGMTESEIAQGMEISTTRLRAMKQIAKTEQRQQSQLQAQKLRDKGMSNVAIGTAMGVNESQVRALLSPGAKEKADILGNTAKMLESEVGEKRFIDIGAGTANSLGGLSPEKLNTAVAMLEEKGYQVYSVKVQQLGTGQDTRLKVLGPPDSDFKELVSNKDKIRTIENYTEDGGRSFLGLETPRDVSSKRIEVRYADKGGSDKDGVIELRRGVDDISLGKSKYAQVRISVDGTHYLKGMAMYADDLPPGVDMRFNTNKNSTGNKLDAMKPVKRNKETGEVDADNPFGSMVRQAHYIDSKGKKQLSALNIVNEEGDWAGWSKNISSQVLSKQSPALAKAQLDLKYQIKKAEYDEIMALTNPAVKRKLLESFSDDMDSSAVHLKAAALPRQSTQVILPINSLKDGEVYAPNYRDGEKVVLVRYPHGGKFEIPELTVNNRNKEANSVIKQARDAIGINSKVASRLSGADFDGDTVLVIPNNSKKIRHEPPLAGLKDFDPQRAYPAYEGMKPMSARTKQLKMGDVSNLITDMTVKGAPNSDLVRAVRHSMVVIDAEKHNLNWKQSAIDNNISQLKKDYQGSSRAGAKTVISLASSTVRVDERKDRSAKNGGRIDPRTGRRMYEKTNAEYVNSQGKVVRKTTKSTKMAEVDDAFKLHKNAYNVMETVYATHANRLKDLANDSRKAYLETKPLPYSPTAKKAYANEVATLNAKLNTAYQNKPRERQAQLLANTIVAAKRQARPDMDAADLKKVKGQALTEARLRMGAKKARVDITPNEWLAIQAGAITNNKLEAILANSDTDAVKALATPRLATVMVPAKVARAKAMVASGYTPSEIADALGVPTSTLDSALNPKEG